jgi:hypothetical protein
MDEDKNKNNIMNKLVQIIRNEDGELIDFKEWHLVTFFGDSPRALCTGEVFGEGEGAAEYKTKEREKGGITCEKCKQIIKFIKDVRL